MSGAKDKSHAHSGPQSRKVENFSVSFNQVSNHIPVDKLVKQLLGVHSRRLKDM